MHRIGSDLDVYDVMGDRDNNVNTNVAVIVLYDIRGFNVTNTRLFCERLAYEYKVRVLMPHFFRGMLKNTTQEMFIVFKNCRSTHRKCNLASCPTRSGNCQHVPQLTKLY